MKTYNTANPKIKKIPTEKIFAVWKPSGISSNNFIQKLKKMLGVKKIGHGGTLDPLAQGVLVVGVDDGTKKLATIKNETKEYIAVIKLGEESLTDDAEGPIRKVKVKKIPAKSDIDKIIKKFSKIKTQTPPLFSAVKVGGIEAYKLARKGNFPKIKARKVYIYSIKVISYKWPILKIKLVTSGGFYVRSLARDIGKELQSGGFLLKLTRTRVGKFEEKDCLKII